MQIIWGGKHEMTQKGHNQQNLKSEKQQNKQCDFLITNILQGTRKGRRKNFGLK